MARELGSHPAVREYGTLREALLELASVCLRSTPTLYALTQVLSALHEESVDTIRQLADRLVAEPVVPFAGHERLKEILQGLDVPGLAMMCRAIVGQLREIPVFHDPWTAFQELERLNADPSGLPPALALIEYVAVEAPYDKGVDLRSWNDAQAGAMGVLPQVRSLRERVGRATAPGRSDATLVVRLEPHEEPGHFLLTSWRHHDPLDPAGWHPRQGESVMVTLESAERKVEALLNEAEEDWAQDSECLHVEFELAFGELDLPVHLWRKELDSDTASPLGVDYPVVVRSLDRARASRWHRPWKQRWRTLVNSPERMRGAVVGGEPPAHPGLREPLALEAWLKADESIGCLVLSGPPTSGTDGAREALMGLRAGLPVLLWGRRDRLGDLTARPAGEAGDSGPVRKSDDSIETLAVHDLPQLRERMRKLRQQAQAGSRQDRQHHVGHHVTLLWDDPTRPVGADEPLTGPDQGVDGL